MQELKLLFFIWLRLIIASAAADAAGQGINIVAGNQDKYEPSQTMKTIAVSTCFAAGEEITIKSIHSLNNSRNNHNNRQASLITNQQQLIDHHNHHLKHKHLQKYSKHKLKELNSNNHKQINCIITKATGIAKGFSLKIIQNKHKKHMNLTKIKAKKKKILQREKNLKNLIK